MLNKVLAFFGWDLGNSRGAPGGKPRPKSRPAPEGYVPDHPKPKDPPRKRPLPPKPPPHRTLNSSGYPMPPVKPPAKRSDKQRIADALERIADALERKTPPDLGPR